ncbi:MAG: Fe-S cluster assembly protein SufD [Cyclobacteriaceae bacterium]|nr:Fe-S cluster assembly protein SufD [Cyclobacteriaceae bacterium]
MNTQEAIELPDSKTESYRFTPIARELARLFDLTTTAESTAPIEYQPHLLPLTGVHNLVFINGKLTEGKSLPWVKVSDDVHTENGLDAFAKLNYSQQEETVSISIPQGTAPGVLCIYYVLTGKANVIAHPRIALSAGPDTEWLILEKAISLANSPTFLNRQCTVSLAPYARLSWVQIQSDRADSFQVNNTEFRVAEKAKFNSYTLSTSGAMIRNNLSVRIVGSEAEAHLFGLYALSGKTHVDNHTVADHEQPNALSNELYKGILADQSKAVFNGKIFVRQLAQKTNAFQSNRNIILSDAATIHTKPQLEIWADDVKCSHGCTAGQLDDEAMFYLRSRGISEGKAKSLLLHAFATEVFESLSHQGIRSVVDEILEGRLNTIA